MFDRLDYHYQMRLHYAIIINTCKCEKKVQFAVDQFTIHDNALELLLQMQVSSLLQDVNDNSNLSIYSKN